jgi:3-hydroxy acid dehydrogenase/malonic semialdehyde reductase
MKTRAGIGEACARKFAEHNAKLILIGRREDRLKSLKSDLCKQYPNLKVHTISMSVTDTDAIYKLPTNLPNEVMSFIVYYYYKKATHNYKSLFIY